MTNWNTKLFRNIKIQIKILTFGFNFSALSLIIYRELKNQC